MRAFALVALLATSLLAGCADGNGGNSATEPTFDLGLTATSSTGVIRGVVVDDAIRPIPGATVVLSGGDSSGQTTTNAEGLFGFSTLVPGTYFLSISKPGYFTTQQSADVVAGVAEPDIVKVLLAIDVANLPFTELLTWTAFLQCGAFLVAGSLNPCAAADSDNVHDFAFGGGRIPDMVHVEAYWEGTQPAGNYLSMGFYDPESLASNWKSIDGTSPLIIQANGTEIQDALGDDANHTTVRLFPGGGPDGTNPTLVLNQRYEVYVTNFYGFVPREGWSIVVDGPCTTPEQCA